MFDVGFSELVLCFVIGLLILGPERLPRVAAQVGRWVGRARRMANQLRYQLEREIALEEIRAENREREQREKTAAAADAESAEAEAAASPEVARAGAEASSDAATDAPAADGPAAADAPAGPGASAGTETSTPLGNAVPGTPPPEPVREPTEQAEPEFAGVEPEASARRDSA